MTALTNIKLWDFHWTIAGRRFRVAAHYGDAISNRRGLWRTRVCDLYGWNLRVGSLRRNVTFLLHTRRVERGEKS